jgi:hypothetical protein
MASPVAFAVPGKIQPGTLLNKERIAMRSDLVFGALSHVSNRYQLCQLASKATRMLHKPNTRVQDTTNEVLSRFRTINPASATQVEATADSNSKADSHRNSFSLSGVSILDLSAEDAWIQVCTGCIVESQPHFSWSTSPSLHSLTHIPPCR